MLTVQVQDTKEKRKKQSDELTLDERKHLAETKSKRIGTFVDSTYCTLNIIPLSTTG